MCMEFSVISVANLPCFGLASHLLQTPLLTGGSQRVLLSFMADGAS